MKVLIQIPDDKADSFMDVMNSISYVKAKPISGKKASVLKDVRQAVEEMHLIKEGKLEARDAQEFLREL
jgi:hypothetical protein